MATKEVSSKYRRASEYAPGIGANLDELINKDVLLVDYSIDERPLNRRRDNDEDESAEAENGYSRSKSGAEQTTIVYITVSENPDDYDPNDRPGTTKMYHAWSESLAEKLANVPKDQLPMLIKFTRPNTGAGFRVWSFE